MTRYDLLKPVIKKGKKVIAQLEAVMRRAKCAEEKYTSTK